MWGYSSMYHNWLYLGDSPSVGPPAQNSAIMWSDNEFIYVFSGMTLAGACEFSKLVYASYINIFTNAFCYILDSNELWKYNVTTTIAIDNDSGEEYATMEAEWIKVREGLNPLASIFYGAETWPGARL